jgi:hypothetical protein
MPSQHSNLIAWLQQGPKELNRLVGLNQKSLYLLEGNLSLAV